jgi:hypothetical protein
MKMLQNFSDYLMDVDEKRGETNGGNERTNGNNAIPVAIGAKGSNIFGGII